MTEALVSPELLRWARKRAALSADTVAERLKTDIVKVLAWEEGAARPTFHQAEKLAAILHVPFGYFFLPAPPDESLPIPDLRTLGGKPREDFSATVRDLLQDVKFQHDWYKEHLLEHGAQPLPFVGRFTRQTHSEPVAADIRATLRFEAGASPGSSWEQHLKDIFDKCEEVGIWVMRSGYVGSNTHRILSVKEFRGFAIADHVVPLIFINGRDAKAAQMFTLAHELAHIWIGDSGISDPDLDLPDSKVDSLESLCNQIASDVLVPRAVFQDAWNDGADLEWNANALSRRFRVSRVVIARRAVECRKIGWKTYHSFFEAEKKGWEDRDEPDGGNFYANMPIKNGRRFTRAVVNSAMSGTLPFRQAGLLLHTKPVTVRKFYEKNQTEP